MGRTSNTIGVCAADAADYDLVLEGAKDYEAELDLDVLASF